MRSFAAVRAGALGALATACLVAFAGAATPASAAAPVPTLLQDATARVPYGLTGGSAELILQITGVTGDTAPNVSTPADIGPSGPKIEFGKPVPLGNPGGIYFFRLPLTVSDLPIRTAQPRTIVIKVGSAATSLAYMLTNDSAQQYTLSVKAPPPIALAVGDWIPVSVIVGPQRATNVKLLSASFTEKAMKNPIDTDGMKLCPDKTPACPTAIPSLAPYTSYPLWIGPVTKPGTYDAGTVYVASDQKAEGDTAQITVYVSSIWWKLLGVGCVIAGVVLAWILTVFIRNRLGREQLRLAAVQVDERLSSLQGQLLTTTADVSKDQTLKQIAQQRGKLVDKELEAHGLPGKWQAIWPALGAPTVAEFRNYVQGVADWAAVLEVITFGLLYIAAKWDSLTPDQKKEASPIAAKIDALAWPSDVPALDVVRQKVGDAIREFESILHPSAALLLADVQQSSREIAIEIQRLSIASWIVLGVITIALGAYVAVFNVPGFGTPLDLLAAFFWGLGLPAASQLSSATTSSVTTALKIPSSTSS
jgi:hypothetical protein